MSHPTSSTSNPTHCAGCHHSFESYEMTPKEGYECNGVIYCNDHCQLESEVDAMESQMYMNECGLNSDGSEW